VLGTVGDLTVQKGEVEINAEGLAFGWWKVKGAPATDLWGPLIPLFSFFPLFPAVGGSIVLIH